MAGMGCDDRTVDDMTDARNGAKRKCLVKTSGKCVRAHVDMGGMTLYYLNYNIVNIRSVTFDIMWGKLDKDFDERVCPFLREID